MERDRSLHGRRMSHNTSALEHYVSSPSHILHHCPYYVIQYIMLPDGYFFCGLKPLYLMKPTSVC